MLSVRRFFVGILCATAAACASAPTAQTPTAKSSITALADAPDQFFTKNDVRIRYRDFGSGEPIVLVHGYTRSLNDWVGIADSLARDHRVIAFDLRGFGQSTKFDQPAKFGQQMVDDIPRLLDHLGIKRAHLIGHSLGALLIANVAQRYPDRVATLGLVAGAFFNEAGATEAGAAWVNDLERGAGFVAFLHWLFPKMPDEMVRGFNQQILADNDMGSLKATMVAFPKLVLQRRPLPGIPTLVIVGTEDPLIDSNRELVTYWTHARLVEVQGADHVTVVQVPQFLTEVRNTMRARRVSWGNSNVFDLFVLQSFAGQQPSARAISGRTASRLRQPEGPVVGSLPCLCPLESQRAA